MQILNSKQHYGAIGLFLHWSMALLLVAGFVSGEVMEEFEDDHDDAQEHASAAYGNLADAGAASSGGDTFFTGLHSGLGILILGLLVLRIVWRTTDRKLATPVNTPAWMEKLVRAGHGALYFVMVALPLTGLAIAMTGSQPMAVSGLGWLGVTEFPVFMSSPFLNDIAEEIHESLIALLFLTVGLHIAATVWHQVVRRDCVAGRMIPPLRKDP